MHSDWFHGVEIVQGRWQHGEEVGYWYPSGLEMTVSGTCMSRWSQKFKVADFLQHICTYISQNIIGVIIIKGIGFGFLV